MEPSCFTGKILDNRSKRGLRLDKQLNKLVGTTIEAVKVKWGAYGLPEEVVISTTDGYLFQIDCKGVDEGEAGVYPGLNFFLERMKERK